MTSAYIKQLNRSLQAQSASLEIVKPDLKQRLIEWFDCQPDVSRVRAYSMAELEQAFRTQGRFLSPILLRLGWQRRRKWSSTGPSSRYWVPPPTGPHAEIG